MREFSVTFTRFNTAELAQGCAPRQGFVDCGLSLREAVHAVHAATSSHAATCGVQANDSQPGAARWLSTYVTEFDTGDAVELSVHFPTTTTTASRARLVRALTARL